MSRPATHAGSWYTGDKRRLAAQIADFFAASGSMVPGARVLIGPHAGYTYCGARLAETYAAWDTTGVRRVFILGPSHHVYFRETAKMSPFARYETPLGSLRVDTEVCDQLVMAQGSAFAYMTEDEDEDEHSFEMHAPFVAFRAQKDNVAPTIVPIMISGMGPRLRDRLVAQLSPYMADPANTFVVSSDFCHWGRRFGYTQYTPKADLSLLAAYKHSSGQPLHASIEFLDRSGMRAASAGSTEWEDYIESTGNTICGQKPVSVVLHLVEKHVDGPLFEWIGYSQSGQAVDASDSSVSYASGYVRMP